MPSEPQPVTDVSFSRRAAADRRAPSRAPALRDIENLQHSEEAALLALSFVRTVKRAASNSANADRGPRRPSPT